MNRIVLSRKRTPWWNLLSDQFIEVLECGHSLTVRSYVLPVSARYCEACAALYNASTADVITSQRREDGSLLTEPTQAQREGITEAAQWLHKRGQPMRRLHQRGTIIDVEDVTPEQRTAWADFEQARRKVRDRD